CLPPDHGPRAAARFPLAGAFRNAHFPRRPAARRPGLLQYDAPPLLARRHLSRRSALPPRTLAREDGRRGRHDRTLLGEALQRRPPHRPLTLRPSRAGWLQSCIANRSHSYYSAADKTTKEPAMPVARSRSVAVRLAAAIALVGAASFACAQEKVLNLYTARHYKTDEALYAGFTKRTGIRINRIEGGEDALFERIKTEGENSPADVFITVDIGRIWRADQAGI